MSQTEIAWVQEPLFPPDVVEVQLRVGLVPSSGHVQWQLEVTCPTDGTLLAMESCPHAPMSRLEGELDEICQRLRQAVTAGSWTV